MRNLAQGAVLWQAPVARCMRALLLFPKALHTCVCVQMLSFMQENDTPLPALCCLPDVRPQPVSTIRLAAFTGDRLFRTLAAASRSPVLEKDSFQVATADVAAVEMLFNIIEGEAPCSMTLHEIVQLMRVAQYYLADDVQRNVPLYIAPALQQASAQEVSSFVLSRMLAHQHHLKCILG